jgi:hypothetical protein
LFLLHHLFPKFEIAHGRARWLFFKKKKCIVDRAYPWDGLCQMGHACLVDLIDGVDDGVDDGVGLGTFPFFRVAILPYHFQLFKLKNR